MSTFPHSLVLICPAAYKAAANAMGEALGWSGDNLPVALSASGQAPATHYGCHAWSQPSAVAIFTGQVTPEVEGVTPEQIDAIRTQLIVSVDQGQGRAHFDAVCAANGLQTIEPA